MTTTAANTAIVAAIVAALALVAIALFTYQGAQANREAACWAEINALFPGGVPIAHPLVDRCLALR